MTGDLMTAKLIEIALIDSICNSHPSLRFEKIHRTIAMIKKLIRLKKKGKEKVSICPRLKF